MDNSPDLSKAENLSKTITFYKSSPLIVDEPLFKARQHLFILRKNNNPKNQSIYDTFLNDLNNYVTKEPSGLVKNVFNMLFSRNLIYLGEIGNVKSFNIPGGILLTPSNELAAIIIDMNTHEIGLDGVTSKCDLIFYSIFFEFIRAAIVCNAKTVAQDKELDQLILNLLNFIFLKIIGATVTLSVKQKSFLAYDIAYFYYRFMKNQHHEVALDHALAINDEYMAEAKFVLKTFDKYERMKDIFKTFVDFKILNDAPPVMIMKLINKYNMFTFYCLTTSLDCLCAMLVTSQYVTDLFPSFGINSSLQKQLEQYVFNQYGKKVKFNSNYLGKHNPSSKDSGDENVNTK